MYTTCGYTLVHYIPYSPAWGVLTITKIQQNNVPKDHAVVLNFFQIDVFEIALECLTSCFGICCRKLSKQRNNYALECGPLLNEIPEDSRVLHWHMTDYEGAIHYSDGKPKAGCMTAATLSCISHGRPTHWILNSSVTAREPNRSVSTQGGIELPKKFELRNCARPTPIIVQLQLWVRITTLPYP